MGRSDVHEIVTALQAQSAFAGCAKADLEDLAKHSNRSSIPANWPLIHQETPADACYVILDGEANVVVRGETVASIGPGAVVGEAGLAARKLRNASVMSKTPLDLLHINAEPFAALVERRPAIKSVLLARTEAAAAAAEG